MPGAHPRVCGRATVWLLPLTARGLVWFLFFSLCLVKFGFRECHPMAPGEREEEEEEDEEDEEEEEEEEEDEEEEEEDEERERRIRS